MIEQMEEKEMIDGTAAEISNAVAPKESEGGATPPTPTRSGPRQALVDLMTEVGFGRIEALEVRDGEQDHRKACGGKVGCAQDRQEGGRPSRLALEMAKT